MDLIKEINNLKHKKNAIILTHCYQNIEIDSVSDYVGDSFYLSKMASKSDADIIVFAGVYFMAQSAKLLSPEKKVLLPNMKSGCLMADMIDAEKLQEFKSKNPNIPVVCYINSTAEVKALSDICCTSSNAIDIVKSLNANKVLFVPDTYLGKYVESKLKDVEVITYNGFCPTHLRIRVEDIELARKNHPEALILAHPECHKEVVKGADFTGSTKEIMEFAKTSKNKKFIIATEKGVADRLKRDYPEKEFILINEKVTCPNMKMNTLYDIYNVLLNEENEITIKEDVFKPARKCLEKMLGQ
ncbi:MAG: quinolinate synthase NadA [Candidatus Gastranaerophilales bacterium]|nr:quinolinate synthase NadA [Candidatus Gastranaerophilales bacterium]